MQRFLRIGLVTILTLLFLSGLLLAGFMYKVKYGFPVSFETEAPAINFPTGRINVLLFSKTTGFRHGESIEAGKEAFRDLALKNNWFLYATEEGGVFNPQQLARFDAVIFNNSTGRVLNDEQREHLKAYVTEGGKLIGIHGAGDDSHRWDWYEQNLLGSRFSHHPLQPQLQEATVTMEAVPDSMVSAGLPSTWSHTEEWYIFFENPRAKGFEILYSIDGEKIIPNGNLLWITDKNFGMGKDHPVAWYRAVGRGRSFYTSMGHNRRAWEQAAFLQMLENAVNWE